MNKVSVLEIPLSQGKAAKIDTADTSLVLQFNWYFDESHTRGFGYARSWTQKQGKRRAIRMHRLILGVDNPRIQIDHINGDTLDNRRVNLRIVSNASNAKNKRLDCTNSTGYKGVHYHKKNDCYTACICVDYKQIHLGSFPTPKEAALTYDRAARKFHGEFARTNKQLGVL